MPSAKIIIVGGGPAGLTTAGALKQAGLEAVILDQGERIGQSWERRYDRLHLHTVKAYSGLAHFPIPRRYPRYLSKDQYAGYLREYASHFDLHFVPNTAVNRVRQEQIDGRPGWAAESASQTWTAPVVVIATGLYCNPNLPVGPGQAQFGGEILHSSQYRTGRAFQGRRVLVIGAGNSGMEIAVDLSEQGASKTALSIRGVPPVVPRDFLGVASQVYALLLYSLPPAFSDGVGDMVSRIAFGDLSRYGLPAPDWRPFSTGRTPIIDVGFADALKHRRIDIRPPVRAFRSTGVIFEGDQEEAFDAVIYATGFRSGLERILEPPGLLEANGDPRFPSGAMTACPGLYFMGFLPSLRGLLYEANLASLRLAKEIVGGI